MSRVHKPRQWVVRGIDVEQYSKSVGVQMANVATFVSSKVPRERHAVEKLLTDQTLVKMAPIGQSKLVTSNLVGYYVRVDIDVNSYEYLRSSRKKIIDAVHMWAEKSRVGGARGFRANAIKDPVIEKNMEGTYSLKFNVLFSDVVFYTTHTSAVGAHTENHATNDFRSLMTLLEDVIDYRLDIQYKAV